MKRFWAALTVQARIVRALMLREMLSKFGRENFGVFWLMGEPIILTLAVMAMWAVWGHEQQAAVGILPFALSAYTLITTWRHVVYHLVHAAQENVSLMFHRNVRFLDTLISRLFLEVSGTGLSFTTIYTVLYVTGFLDPIYDPYMLVGGFLLAAWFATAVGLTFAGLSTMYPIIGRFVQPFMYVSLPFTGFIYMVSWLPDKLARLAVYSPLVNCFELFRDGLLGHQVEAQWYFVYVVKVNIIMTALGLMLVRRAQLYLQFE